METETYLNLGSEQFNSWINEFDSKYNKIEKNLETNQTSESENEILEESSESEEEEASSIFISKKNIESEVYTNNSIPEPNFSSETENTELNKRKRIFIRGRTITNSSESEKVQSKSTESNNKNLHKEIPDNKNLHKEIPIINNENKINYNNKEIDEDIISLSELNNMLPDYNNKVKNVEADQLKPKKEEKKSLGEVALYKYILNRRRR